MNPTEQGQTPQTGYKSITGLVDQDYTPAVNKGVDFTPGAHPGAQKTSSEVKCSVCGALLTERAYAVKGEPACTRCAEAAGVPIDSHVLFTTALVYGMVAAIGGCAFYAGFTIAFHFYIGYVALAVGWMVGKAMMAGSKGVGGRKYQIVAVALTYLAISLASVPIMIAEAYERGKDINWARLAPVLVLYGVASPLLDLAGGVAFGLIGLIIVFVGLRIAWRLTAAKKLKVAKPVGTF